MKKIKLLIGIIFFLYIQVNAQSFLHLGFGIGQYGGSTTYPYHSPFLSYDGYSIDMEYESFFQRNISLSIFLTYSSYNKMELFLEEANSNIFYFGLACSFTNQFEVKKVYYKISPMIAFGFEEIRWRDNIGHFLFSNSPEEIIKGRDKLNYISLGITNSLGLKIKRINIEFAISPKYDILIWEKRSILENAETEAISSKLENPDYKSEVYFQCKISLGIPISILWEKVN